MGILRLKTEVVSLYQHRPFCKEWVEGVIKKSSSTEGAPSSYLTTMHFISMIIPKRVVRSSNVELATRDAYIFVSRGAFRDCFHWIHHPHPH